MITKHCDLYFAIANGNVTEVMNSDAPITVFCDPSDEVKSLLVDKLLIDEHTMQSALDPDETARLEFEPSHVAVIIKRPTDPDPDAPNDFHVSSLGAFLYEDKLVIVQSDRTPLFQGGRPLGRCESFRGALLQLIYHTIAQFQSNVRFINQLSNSIEKHIEYSIGNKALSSMFALQKSLVYYQSAAHSNHIMLNKLRMNGERIGFTAEEMEMLEDMIVENDQCTKLVEIYSSILTGMSDARVSIISNNLSVLMKKLTVISIVFMPLNILASMGGMSEWTMMTKTIPWPISYLLFTLLLVVIGYITWLVIRNIGVKDSPVSTKNPLRLFARCLHSFLG